MIGCVILTCVLMCDGARFQMRFTKIAHARTRTTDQTENRTHKPHRPRSKSYQFTMSPRSRRSTSSAPSAKTPRLQSAALAGRSMGRSR